MRPLPYLFSVLAALVLAASPLRAQDGVFAFPDGSRAAHRQLGHVVDCAAHGGWTAPPGWEVRQTAAHDVVARAPDGLALLVRAARPGIRSTETFVAAVARVVTRVAGAEPTLEAPTEHARDRWHVDRGIAGSVTVAGRTAHVRASSDGEWRLWVQLALAPTHDAAMDAATAGWLQLTDHACVCGYDCDRRPTP